MSIHDWRGLTTTDLAELVDSTSVALLPIAAIEQHGMHLPLATDVIIGEYIVTQALGCFDRPASTRTPSLFVLPTQTVGTSTEHAAYAGTLSLAPETLIATVEAMGQSLARAGIRRLVVFNSHGGNTAALDIAALKLRAQHGLRVVKATYFKFGTPPGLGFSSELDQDLHAGALETSLMLHIKPDWVRLDQIPFSPTAGRAATGSLVAPEGTAPYAWLAEDFGPNGTAGQPSRATAEAGKQLLDHFIDCLSRIIRDSAELNISD